MFYLFIFFYIETREEKNHSNHRGLVYLAKKKPEIHIRIEHKNCKRYDNTLILLKETRVQSFLTQPKFEDSAFLTSFLNQNFWIKFYPITQTICTEDLISSLLPHCSHPRHEICRFWCQSCQLCFHSNDITFSECAPNLY